jgi:DNA-binding protein HU-beta
MNKSEFTRAYADRLGVTIKEAEVLVAPFIETTTECLQNSVYVHISGFATFDLKTKNARDGVISASKEKVLNPACKAPNAKFSKSYKALFNK